jgi:hypothetical protein
MSKIILEPMSLCYCLFEIDLKIKYLGLKQHYPQLSMWNFNKVFLLKVIRLGLRDFRVV